MRNNKQAIESLSILVDDLYNRLGFYNAYSVINNYSDKYKGAMLYILLKKYKPLV